MHILRVMVDGAAAHDLEVLGVQASGGVGIADDP